GREEVGELVVDVDGGCTIGGRKVGEHEAEGVVFGEEFGGGVGDGVGGVEEADGGDFGGGVPVGGFAHEGGVGEKGAVYDDRYELLFEVFGGLGFGGEGFVGEGVGVEVEGHLFEVGEMVGEVFDFFFMFETEEAAEAGAVGGVGEGLG